MGLVTGAGVGVRLLEAEGVKKWGELARIGGERRWAGMDRGLCVDRRDGGSAGKKCPIQEAAFVWSSSTGTDAATMSMGSPAKLGVRP